MTLNIGKICLGVVEFFGSFVMNTLGIAAKEVKGDQKMIRSSKLTNRQINVEIIDLVG